ncbi:MAG: enoyl-CoA hydratase-related protein [Propylenella sp.]
MGSHEAEPILQLHHDGWTHLILNRPEKLNALTEEMLVLLHRRLNDCAGDTSVRAVLLSGAGRAFCAGQDLKARDPRRQSAPFDLEAVQKRLYHPLLRLMRGIDKPVVVAVAGIAAGAGIGIALSADVVVAQHSARFVQSFAGVGLSVDAGAGWMMTRALGGAVARGLLLTGGHVTGEEASAMGLIWKSYADDILMREAEALTQRLATGPTLAFAAIKKAVAAAEAASLDDYLATEAALQGEVGRSADYREGVLAFLERREARFQGR